MCKDGCRRTVAYVPNDIKERTTSCMGERGLDKYIECPGCKKIIVVQSL